MERAMERGSDKSLNMYKGPSFDLSYDPVEAESLKEAAHLSDQLIDELLLSDLLVRHANKDDSRPRLTNRRPLSSCISNSKVRD
jgi:hypothetical protein